LIPVAALLDHPILLTIFAVSVMEGDFCATKSFVFGIFKCPQKSPVAALFGYPICLINCSTNFALCAINTRHMRVFLRRWNNENSEQLVCRFPLNKYFAL